MKKNLTKKIALALALVLIAISAFALSSCTSYDLPEGAVDWTLSDDFKTLTNETDGIEYELYDSRPSTLKNMWDVYVYFESFSYKNHNSRSNVYRAIDYKEVVWLNYGGSRYYYATKDGKEHLDALHNGEVSKYLACNEKSESYLSNSIPESVIENADRDLKNGVNVEEFDTRILDNYPLCYYVEAFDSTGNFSYNYALLYRTDLQNHDYLYVKLSDLDPDALDQSGLLDYDSGLMISMVRINDLQIGVTADYENNYIYESDEIQQNSPETTAVVTFSMVLFWIAVVVIGFVIPFPLFVLGCALAFIKKLGRPKYWLAVSVFALFWMLFAAIFSLVIILIILI